MAFTQLVHINDIVEGDRGRKDYGDVAALADSLERVSQIQPIVLAPGNVLTAGGRRFRATQLLASEGRAIKGFKVGEIMAVYNGHLKDNPVLFREIELEENLQRKDLDHVERAMMTLEIDRLKRAEHGDRLLGAPAHTDDTGWGLADTATLLDKPTTTVHRDIALGLIYEEFPELKQLETRADVFRWLDHTLALCLRERDRRRIAKLGIEVSAGRFAQARAQDYIPTLPDEAIDLVLVDPPYGVDYESRTDTFAPTWDDSETGTLALLNETVPLLTTKVKRNAHLYMFTSEFLLHEVKTILYRNGWDVSPVSLVWLKNTTGQVDFAQKYGPRTEFVVFARRPHTRRLNHQAFNDLRYSSVPPSNRSHPTEKPQDLLKFLIEQSTIPGEAVLDFCAGSGATLVSALETERLYYGCEPDPNYYAGAANWLAKAAYFLNLAKQREVDHDDAEGNEEMQGEAGADL